tara:strand:+ start:16 stop:735 length:720 start_codon:yes stop_codon:yes gene_type:complete
MSIRLGVNIDHVATIRNARGEIHPDPYQSAKKSIEYGANSITIHLREDRRHIRDSDLKIISSDKSILLNLEISSNLKMLKIALKHKPNFICLVPEKRKEITTEGGLNLKKNIKKLKYIVNILNNYNIRTSLFINPTMSNVKLSKYIGSKCIELHTGTISNKIKNKKSYHKELKNLKKCSNLAKSLGLEVHAGHGMDYKTAKILSKISEIHEFNIGHFIIGESIIYGLRKVIQKFIKILK